MKSSIYYLFHASHDNGIDELAELHPAADACGCHVPAAALFTAECHVHRHPPHMVPPPFCRYSNDSPYFLHRHSNKFQVILPPLALGIQIEPATTV